MRLIALPIILCSFFFLCSVAQAYYTITPDKTFFVGDITYCFSRMTNVTSIGKDGFLFIVDGLRMMTTANASVIVRINSFNSSMVNFTYSANKTCDVFFNCSGLVFNKVYLGGNETLNVTLPVAIVEPIIDVNNTVEEFNKVEDGVFNSISMLFPLLMLSMILLMMFFTVSRF